jgi:hypothetical protein
MTLPISGVTEDAKLCRPVMIQTRKELELNITLKLEAIEV